MARIATSLAAAAVLFQAANAQTVHRVDVGEGGLTFEPAELTAAVGDSVEFHFLGGFHSVARSSFDSPCTPVNGSDNIFSGPITGPSDEVFTVPIESEDPIWYYCATGQHCQNGMVGVINAP
ncbi:Cupredoxin [Plectosphaerella cucumerina]|uniref:Cupredoxin n=1 Tax=Plectosphaerella cucumerina TaxID=40658 RepID=A0A8K0X2S1_9PEZI|nr:Cupredoxin [Plectosphaerella cucumerina]